jgi:peptide/nickel transport system substrate-binding protein
MRSRSALGALVITALVGTSLVATTASAPAAKMPGQKAVSGSVTFALEAETTGGFCLPQAQLAASGHQVRVAIYDSLTTINTKGDYVPYLAKSVEPNATFDEWTIALRDGVKFHDGTPVDAEAVKLNIDALRGVIPALPARLFSFVYSNIDTVTVADPLTAVVTTKTPWPAFPAFLVERGIVAPAQLNDPATCATNLLGSGPFKLVEWRPNESLTVEANTDYWRKGYPKVGEIVFRPVPDAQSRVNGLKSGEYDLLTTSSSLQIVDLQQQAEAGEIKVIATDKGAETAFLQLNSGKPPFDDRVAREAVALAGDAREVNDIRNKGLNTISTGPFPPGTDAYLPGVARMRDLKRAKALAKQYEAEHGQPISFEYLTVNDPENLAIAQLVKEQQSEAGIEVSIRGVDQPTLINEALAGSFTGMGFRQHPGGDPDTQYVWWHSGSPVNFGRIDDPEIDALLDEGRVETDPAKRTKIYQDLTREFAKEWYMLWSWYTYWAVGYQNDVKGVTGPPLPDGGGKPFALFAGVIPVVGIAQS